jgi:hypothetical protein
MCLSMLCNPNPRIFLFVCLVGCCCCGIYSFRFLSVERVSDGDCGSGLDNSLWLLVASSPSLLAIAMSQFRVVCFEAPFSEARTGL